MKHLFLVLFTTSILVTQACSNGKPENAKQANPTETVADAKVENNQVGGAIHLTKAQFIEKVWDYELNSTKWVYKGDKPCIIDFYADWCRPCKIAGPILEELAAEYKGQIYVYKIDTEKERELASAFGIQSIPAFLYCPTQGEPQMAAGIGQTPEATKQMFKSIIDEFLLGKK